MNMITPVTVQTINNLAANAGILLKNFDYSSATDATSLAALVVSESARKNNWLGATKGNVNIQEGRGWWSPEFNGKRMVYKGEKQFSEAAPKITGSLVEYTPENVKAVSGIATVSPNGNIITVQPRASISEGDYMTNVVWITNHGTNGLYLVDLKNALCTSGMNSQHNDKDIGTMPFEFSGHADNVEYKDELPISYLFFGVAEVAQTSEQDEPAAEE